MFLSVIVFFMQFITIKEILISIERLISINR